MHPLARRPVLALAAGVVVVLAVTVSRYGYHRDELYFLAAGRRLAWGYPDQPPLTPLLARAADELAPGSLLVLRLWPALALGVVVALTGLMARDLGPTGAGSCWPRPARPSARSSSSPGTCTARRRSTCWPGPP